MSDSKKATVRFYKKRNTQKEKITFNYNEIQIIRKWLITGSFNNSFFLNESFDKSKINLIKKVIQFHPERIEELLEETLPLKLNHSTFIYTLVLLSAGPFKAKRIFKTYFEKIILKPKHLYKFMEFCKKERGFGKIIHEAINNWFKHNDTKSLSYMFVKERAGNNWKAQDVIRLMKPKPTDKKEQLFFKWLAKDYINEEEEIDYKEYFPHIVEYENMRKGKSTEEDICNAIKELQFSNNMIPGNVERTDTIIYNWLVSDYNHFYPSYGKTYTYIPRYLHKLNGHTTQLLSFFKERKMRFAINIITLLMVYSEMKEKAFSGEDMEMLNLSEEALLDRIRKTYNPSIHIVDTGIDMFSNKINSIRTSSAVASSVMIGMSKNVFDLDGNKFSRKDPRSILEAEGYIRENKSPKYNKIFEAIEDIDENTIFVWTSNKNFPKEIFYKKFKDWKIRNNKQMKLVFVNLTDKKESTNNVFKEIYGIDKKTPRLMKYIKEGVV